MQVNTNLLAKAENLLESSLHKYAAVQRACG
jgi:hypothetical protein